MYQDWGVCSEVIRGGTLLFQKSFRGSIDVVPLRPHGKSDHDGKWCSQVPPIPTNPTQSRIWFRDTTDNQMSSSDGPTEQKMGNLCSNRRQTSDLNLSNLVSNECNKRTGFVLCKPNPDPFFSLAEAQTGSMQSSPILLWIH